MVGLINCNCPLLAIEIVSGYISKEKTVKFSEKLPVFRYVSVTKKRRINI